MAPPASPTPSSSGSSSGFSSDVDDDEEEMQSVDQQTYAAHHTVHVDVVDDIETGELASVRDEEDLSKDDDVVDVQVVDIDALAGVVAECCMEAAKPLLQGSLSYYYELYANAIYHVTSHWPVSEHEGAGYDDEDEEAVDDRKGTAYRTLRAALYARFQKAFPLTPEMYMEWIGDVSSDAKATLRIYERSLRDYHSVPLSLQFAQFMHDHEGDGDGGITESATKALVEPLLRIAGMHFTQGHEVWRFQRELLSQHEFASPLQKEQRMRELYLRQMKIPLQQNDLAMSEFRAWNNYNTLEQDASRREQPFDDAVKRQTKVFGPFLKKLNQFEDRIVAAQAGVKTQGIEGDTLEQVWLQYLNFVTYRIVPLLESDDEGELLLRSMFERAVAMVCLSATLWSKYAEFLKAADAGSDVEKLALYQRAVRNVCFDSSMWNDLLLEMELQGTPIDRISAYFESQVLARTNPFMMDQLHFLSVLITYCDIHRRHAAKEPHKYDPPAMDKLEQAFTTCASFMETHFPDFAVGLTRILEYHAKCCLLARSVDTATKFAKWDAIWSRVVQKRSHEAEIWLSLYQESMRTGAKPVDKIRDSVFQSAMQHVKDYPASVLEVWLIFERENGSLQDYLHVRELHADLTAQAAKALQSEALPATSNAAAQPESKKRKASNDGKAKREQKEPKRAKLAAIREEPSAQKPPRGTTKREDPVEKKQAHERLTNEHTLFVSNISKEVTKEELEAFFQEIPGLKDVRLVVKARAHQVKSRGMAYVQFTDEAGVAEGLTKNGHELKGQAMSVERSKPPVSAAATGGGAKGRPDLGRDGSWKTNPVTIYVGGLHNDANEHIGEARLQEGIQQALHAAGELIVVKRVSILKDKRGKPKDYGLVEVAAPEQTAKCVAHLEGIKKLLGDQITLKPSRFSIDQILLQQQNQMHRKNERSSANSDSVQKGGKRGKDTGGAAPAAVSSAPHKPTSTSMMGLMPRALRRKHLAVSDSTTSTTTSSSSSTTRPPQTSIDNKPKTNDDFRKLLMKQE